MAIQSIALNKMSSAQLKELKTGIKGNSKVTTKDDMIEFLCAHFGCKETKKFDVEVVEKKTKAKAKAVASSDDESEDERVVKPKAKKSSKVVVISDDESEDDEPMVVAKATKPARSALTADQHKELIALYSKLSTKEKKMLASLDD